MLNSPNRCPAALAFVFVCAATVSAQQQSGGQTTSGASGTGSSLSGTGTQTAGTNDASSMLSLDQDAAFSAVERANVIGQTGETAAGFSALSAANAGGGAGGGIGGLGGRGGAFGGLGGLGNLFGNLNQGAGQTQRPVIRTRLRQQFEIPYRETLEFERMPLTSFRPSYVRPEFNEININMQGGTATLSGQVASEQHRRMSELLLRLEPGVRAVDNRLIVAPK